MKVIVDTSVWSLVLRRSSADLRATEELNQLIRGGRVQILGLIRQELLSGIRTVERFKALKEELAHYVDLPITTEDHEEAAGMFNRCRARGIQGNVVDMLICAIAVRHQLSIFTTDHDFEEYARHVPIKLHQRF